MLYIVTAGEVRTLVVVVDHIRIPLGTVLAGEERCIRSHADHIGITLYMEQIEALGQCIDELLVLSGILSQINLRFAVAGVAVILALVQEELVGFIVVLIEDRHGQLISEFPTILKVGVVGM